MAVVGSPFVRARIVLLAAVVALAPVACGSDDPDQADGTTTTAPGGAEAPSVGSGADEVEMPDLSAETFKDQSGRAEVVVDARDNTFRAAYIEVDPGTTITFRNVGRTEHDVYPVVEDAFTPITAEMLQPKDKSEITFDEPGEYPYYCTLHGTTTKGMVGAVRVLGE